MDDPRCAEVLAAANARVKDATDLIDHMLSVLVHVDNVGKVEMTDFLLDLRNTINVREKDSRRVS